MRAFSLAVLLLAGFNAHAQKNPDLEKAQKELAAKNYAAALKSIDAAEKKGGIDHDSYMTLLESRGLAEASLKKTDKATETFKQLLVLDPRRDMAGKYKGEVVKAVDAALDWVKANGGIAIIALEPTSAGGKVKQVSVSVKSDPLNEIKTIRINVKQDGGTWKPVDAALVNGVATADADGVAVEFWAEALDTNKDQLFFLGSAVRPVKQVAAADTAKPAPKPAPVAATPPPASPAVVAAASEIPAPPPDYVADDNTPKASTSGALRTASYPVLAVAVIAAGVGIYFGAISNSAKSSILADQMAGTMTNQQLYDRDQSRIGQAGAANGLFITAAVLLVAAVIMFAVGG